MAIKQSESEHKLQSEKLSKKGMQVFLGIQLVLLVIAFIIMLNIGVYGWTLFCLIPFSLGMTVGVYTKTYKSRRLWKGGFWALLILFSIFLMLLLVRIEGVICILMATVIIIVPAMGGMIVGYLIRNAHRIYGLGLILFFNSSAYVYDKYDTDHVESVASESITIYASGERVWNVLTNKVEYTSNDNLFFKSGVSYPENMQLKNRKGKCFLVCELNNGFADLPVIELDSLKRLRFTIPSDIIPMKEMTPYDTIHAEHLKGYFQPQYGEFRISSVSQGQCMLTAETAYSYKITPVFYWRLWSDYLVNTMHRHVLENIKEIAETSTVNSNSE